MYLDLDDFFKMIWLINYYWLVVVIIFMLFFVGCDFVFKCIIDGMNIQDYLQLYFVNVCVYLVKCIYEVGDLEDEVVMGWESMNEFNCGLIGYEDLMVILKEYFFKKGICLMMWQIMLMGMGWVCEVDVWEMGGFGFYKIGMILIDFYGQIVWLFVDYNDIKYGWKCDEDWKLGECIWV